MFNDHVEPFDYEDSPRFTAHREYEREIMDQEAEKSLERSLALAEQADDILEDF